MGGHQYDRTILRYPCPSAAKRPASLTAQEYVKRGRGASSLRAFALLSGRWRVVKMSEDEKTNRPARRASSDNNLLRPRADEKSSHDGDALEETGAAGSTGGASGNRGRRHRSEAGTPPQPSIPVGAGVGEAGKAPKQPGWGRKVKTGRSLFFRSGTPKTQDGESPPVLEPRGPSPKEGKVLSSAGAAAASLSRKSSRSEST